jgi:deoxycytidine triphosphate deaminase
LRDEIEFYANNHKMIHPFKPKNLKPAGYELSVGEIFAMDGKVTELRPGEKLAIPPFSVAVIQTLETLNLPHHLIARWNVRTKWAYKGLLWVGAAQVDAGFRGYLACPLYNLSNQTVEVSFGDEIAVIDFVTTTPPTAASAPFYQWRDRTRVTFREYEPEKLQSALATDVKDRLERFESELRKGELTISGQISAVQSRVDTFTSTTFTVIAMLFAALGLAVARTAEPSFWSSAVWLGALSLWFAMRAYVLTKSRLQMLARQTGALAEQTRVPWQAEFVLGVAIAGLLLFAQFKETKVVSKNLGQIQSQMEDSRRQLESSEVQLKDLKTANINLQKELDDLKLKLLLSHAPK